MRKGLIICFLILALLISFKDAYAVDCKPTVSWRTDSRFYVGETGKAVATVRNTCEKSFSIKTEVNAERTEDYVKVYTVQSEDEEPRPKSHIMKSETASSSPFLESGEIKKIVFFIQPDEQALAGYYTLFENFYVDGALQDSKEARINVFNPIRIAYQFPKQTKLNSPISSSLTINNIGAEIITSLKICLSSDVVSFSESCKTWTNLPSGFTDKFTFLMNGLVPGDFQDPISVEIDFDTSTGLKVSDIYYHPTLKITAVAGEVPSLTYTSTKGTDSISIQIVNAGNGIGYDCSIRLISPITCSISSSDITNFTGTGSYNSYLIGCPDIILPGDSIIRKIDFDPEQMTSSCTISGSITYKDSSGVVYETKITNIAGATTTPYLPEEGSNYVWYVVIIAITLVAAILIVFKVPKVRNFLLKKFKFRKPVKEEPVNKEVGEKTK